MLSAALLRRRNFWKRISLAASAASVGGRAGRTRSSRPFCGARNTASAPPSEPHLWSARTRPNTAPRVIDGRFTVMPDARADVRGELMDRAAELLIEHRPDEFGLCTGCMASWGRYIPYAECTNAQWAVRVIETHGVPETAWLVPTHVPDWLTAATKGDASAAVYAARSATCTAGPGPSPEGMAAAGEVTSCERTGGSVGAPGRPAGSPPMSAPADVGLCVEGR